LIGLFLMLARLTIMVVAVLVVGFICFWAALPIPVPSQNISASAIVVVTGGQGRIATALALLESGRAPQMFISGVGQNVTLRDLVREAGGLRRPDLMRCCITLGHQAMNTFENGTETAAWLKANHIKDVILVSSNYHLPRAELELRMAAPDVKITAFPTDTQTTAHWWQQRWTTELIVGEYLKTLWVLGRYTPKLVNQLFALGHDRYSNWETGH